jgi:uncharacterized RDD family membrane protein YckC
MNAAQNLMGRITAYIIDPMILVVFACGFFLFVYGLVEFLWNLNSGGDNKEGKQHMVWGIVGMLIMVSVYGILALIDNTFQLDFRNPDVSRANNINIPSNLFGGN